MGRVYGKITVALFLKRSYNKVYDERKQNDRMGI
jgi:hypothetical protein